MFKKNTKIIRLSIYKTLSARYVHVFVQYMHTCIVGHDMNAFLTGKT